MLHFTSLFSPLSPHFHFIVTFFMFFTSLSLEEHALDTFTLSIDHARESVIDR